MRSFSAVDHLRRRRTESMTSTCVFVIVIRPPRYPFPPIWPSAEDLTTKLAPPTSRIGRWAEGSRSRSPFELVRAHHTPLATAGAVHPHRGERLHATCA